MVLLQVICFRKYLWNNYRPVSNTFLLEPTAAPLDVRGHNTSSTSILVEWDDVPPFDQNGIITNYTITYRSLTEGHNGSAIAGPSDFQKELTDLKEYVDYDITVFASTSKGDGPHQLLLNFLSCLNKCCWNAVDHKVALFLLVQTRIVSTALFQISCLW